jgi:hypothetical protein
MEGGWDRPRDCARMLRERDGNNKPLAEGDKNGDNDAYSKDGDIPDDEDEYAVGAGSVNDPLDKGSDECDTLSAAPTQVCPESQRPSVPSRQEDHTLSAAQ